MAERSPLPWPNFVFGTRMAFLVAGVLVLAGLVSSVGSHTRSYVLLSTTTSTRDTGLLDYLLPRFTEDTGIDVRYVAFGTGVALDMARRGDVDAVLVHAPSLELAFMAEGHGLCRSPVMYNEFLLVGPPSDPAGIRGLGNATEAFRRILTTRSPFVSRGDNSGTNVLERSLWALVGYEPNAKDDPWYIESGQGMGMTLAIASEKGAYTLTDEGTFAAQRFALNLEVDVRGDPALLNHYHVIVVNPARHPAVNRDGALDFAHWTVSDRGQSLIAGYEVGGQTLFHPEGQDLC